MIELIIAVIFVLGYIGISGVAKGFADAKGWQIGWMGAFLWPAMGFVVAGITAAQQGVQIGRVAAAQFDASTALTGGKEAPTSPPADEHTAASNGSGALMVRRGG